jgi:hypothetical protein
MDNTDPLSQLADIHLPAEIGFWPPAPGWWLLLALLIAALIWAGFRALKQWQQRRRYNFALAELDKCYQQHASRAAGDTEQNTAAALDLVNGVNTVLRRVALKHFPDDQVASLSGQQWVDFIRTSSVSTLLDDQIAIALAQGRFARRCEVDTEKLHAMAQQWIKGLYLAKIKPTQSLTTAAPEHA